MISIIAMIIGYIGTLMMVLSFQCKNVHVLFVFQMVAGGLFVVHYGLKGDYTGMVMDLIACIRALCMASGKKWLNGKPACCVLSVITIVLCIVTWKDIFSIFPSLAIFTMTIALFTGRGNVIRWTQLGITSPGWMAYNIYVGSIPGIICEIMDMTSVIVYFIRTRKDRKQGNLEPVAEGDSK